MRADSPLKRAWQFAYYHLFHRWAMFSDFSEQDYRVMAPQRYDTPEMLSSSDAQVVAWRKLLLSARGLLPPFDSGVDVFVLIEDETLRKPSLKCVQDLRATGLAVDYSLTPAKPDKQFKRAQELKAAHTARLEKAVGGELDSRGGTRPRTCNRDHRCRCPAGRRPGA